MSQLVKFSVAAALVLAGFFSASLLGPPEHLASVRNPADPPGQLVPIEAPPTTSPGVSTTGSDPQGVTPAGFTNPFDQGFASSVRAAHYPEAPGSGGTWGQPTGAEASLGSTLPDIRRAEVPTGSQAPPLSDRGLADLSPPPQLGDFSQPLRTASQPSTGPESHPLAPPTTSPSITPPQATFAQQPGESSPWANRTAAAEPATPVPWSTVDPTGNTQRTPTSLHTPMAEGPGGWDEPRESRPIRWHVVADGDSLPRLAQRYLNDPNRGAEIYEENRNVLKDPEVLPIGVQLRIPDAATTPTAVQVYDAQGTVHEGIQARRLVELPDVAPSAAAPPVARLRTPQFAGSGN